MSDDTALTALQQAIHTAGHEDPYRRIRDMTERHRTQHKCSAYPFQHGPMLGAVAREHEATRILELGTALGYTACWWAHDGAHVDTIDDDPVHATLARDNIAQAGHGDRIRVHAGRFDAIVKSLSGPYDIAFFDGHEPTDDALQALRERVAPDGVVVVTNLGLAATGFADALLSTPDWRTAIVNQTAISVRR